MTTTANALNLPLLPDNYIWVGSATTIPNTTQTLPTTIQENITALGTIGTGVWRGTIVTGTYGGTGINNGSSTLSYGGNTAFSGPYTFTGTLTANTAVTFPTSGTLATVAGTISSISGTANEIGASTVSGATTISIVNNPILPGTGGVQIPSGTTAQRAGNAGTMRFNSQSGVFEGTVDGTNWATFESSATGVTSVSGTASQIDVSPTTGACVVSIDSGYVGQTSITTLGTIATGVWAGTTIALNHGGTNNALTASAGGIVWSDSTKLNILSGTATAGLPLLSGNAATPSWGSYALSLGGALTTAGALTTSGAYSATFTFTNATTVTFPTSGTLATTSASAQTFDADSGSATPSSGVITISGGTTGLTTTASGSTVDLTGVLNLAGGGTNHALTASAGGIVWSDSTKLNILSGTSTANQLLLSGNAATPAWSTTTYPTTNAINTLLYASAANVMSALPTATTAVLTTAAGVPTWASELSLALGGTNADLTAAAGGVVYSTASALAITAAGSSGQLVISQGTSAPIFTTSTYPTTNAINTLLYASSANVMAALATVDGGTLTTSTTGAPTWLAAGSTSGVPLIAQGASTPPVYGTAVVAGGGTGNTSATAYAVLCGGTTSTGAFQSIASVGTSGQVLTSNGAGALPTFQAAGGGSGIASVNVQIFTASGVYTPTTGMVQVLITCVGGGAGGGGAQGTTGDSAVGGGGGAGAAIQALFSAAAVGSSQTVTIGGGGAGGLSTPTNGSVGVQTSVGSLITANGGAGGIGGASTSSNNSISAGGAGATTTTVSGNTGAALVIVGQNGSPGFTSPTASLTSSGAGGNSMFGSGGQGIMNGATGFTIGANGYNYGSGGSGGSVQHDATGTSGGAGAGGIVICLEYI